MVARHECARFGEHLYGDAAECCKDFFCWTLGNSSMKFGNQALEDVFTKYDTDKSGLLDPFEFAKACSDLGLEAVSHTIFKALDEDNSGAISYKELMNAMAAFTVELRHGGVLRRRRCCWAIAIECDAAEGGSGQLRLARRERMHDASSMCEQCAPIRLLLAAQPGCR